MSGDIPDLTCSNIQSIWYNIKTNIFAGPVGTMGPTRVSQKT